MTDPANWILASPAILLVFYLAHKYWPRSPTVLFHHRYREWQESCRRRGLTPEQQNDEFFFRLAWAKLRRRVSEFAVDSPGGYREEIDRVAGEEAEVLARIDRTLAKRFLGVVETSPLSDILYPQAMAKVDGYLRTVSMGYTPTADDIAAVTTR
jgi:hypothetical protein